MGFSGLIFPGFPKKGRPGADGMGSVPLMVFLFRVLSVTSSGLSQVLKQLSLWKTLSMPSSVM